jgi:hypothetical protein
LEQRIRELTEEQHDGRSLEDVERRNAELEEELRRLRENLPSTENMVISNFALSMCKRNSRSIIPETEARPQVVVNFRLNDKLRSIYMLH